MTKGHLASKVILATCNTWLFGQKHPQKHIDVDIVDIVDIDTDTEIVDIVDIVDICI